MADLAYLFLPLGVFVAWWYSKTNDVARAARKRTLSSEYYTGLNFLLNDQTDKAVAAFIKILDASPDSVETTLAIGNFFRRRGEVDRAICLRQNLIAKPDLTQAQRYAALLELAQDYMQAGVFDRAEGLLLELIGAKAKNLSQALKQLLKIYEQEKEWQKAIETALQYQIITGNSLKHQIAHYYCELADKAWHTGKATHAFKLLKKGLAVDKRCVRVLFQSGEYEIKLGNLKNALKQLKSVEFVDKNYLSEAVNKILYCFNKLGDQQGLFFYLNGLYQRAPNLNIVSAYAQVVCQQQGTAQAHKILYEYVNANPSLKGLKGIIELYLIQGQESYADHNLLYKLVNKICKDELAYRCSGCGFEVKLLYWQCPSCRVWGQVKPVN